MDKTYAGIDFLQTVFNLIPSDASEETDKSIGKGKAKRRHSNSGDTCNTDRGTHRKKKQSEDTDSDYDQVGGGGHPPANCDTTGQGSSPTQLHEKIQQRIRECKGKRNKTREEILVRRRERKNKKKKSSKKNRLTTNNKTAAVGDSNECKAAKATDKRRPTFNKEGKLVFSKFDFSEEKKHKNRSVSGLVGKDYKRILQTLEKRKEKVESLRSEDATAADEMSKREAYSIAISKAQGLKVKDDPALVAKAMRRKEKQGKKSKKLWKQRAASTEKLMNEKQEKRTRNLNARRQGKVEAKVKRAKKRGRVAGF